jgi:hypothetical protein
MGLNCGCPAGNHIADLTIAECKESMGQIQKVAFQRIYKTAGTKNLVADPVNRASFSALLSATDGSRMTVSPYIQGPTSEPGAARTFGGGNQTLGGIEIVIGREPTTFSATIYQESQKTIAQLKQYMCEEIGVWLIDENGNIGCLVDNKAKPITYSPIPISKFFVGDKKLGGLEEPDSNTIEWSFHPNWSDNFCIIKRETLGFNPLTEWVNVAASAEV